MTLLDAPRRTTLIVESVGGERSFRRRLLELGLVPGTRVDVRSFSAFGGPLEIDAQGCRLSIRRAEAAQVRVGRASEVRTRSAAA